MCYGEHLVHYVHEAAKLALIYFVQIEKKCAFALNLYFTNHFVIHTFQKSNFERSNKIKSEIFFYCDLWDLQAILTLKYHNDGNICNTRVIKKGIFHNLT